MAASDDRRRLAVEDRGVTVSDSVAAGTLIVIALVLGGGLGVAVLSGGSDAGPPSANFSFQYFSENGALIVTHERGDEIQAGNIVLSKSTGEASATWATVANSNNSTMVGPGDTIQLSERGAFGAPVDPSDTVEVRWETGNQTKLLATWQREGP